LNIRLRDKEKRTSCQLAVMGCVMSVKHGTYLADNIELLNNVIPAVTVCPLGRYISVEFLVSLFNRIS
jgi:hypothetical protein